MMLSPPGGAETLRGRDCLSGGCSDLVRSALVWSVLDWFGQFLSQFNGRCMMEYVGLQQAELSLEVDACLTGIGGIFGDEIYHTSVPDDIPLCKYNITHLEFLNILIAVKLWKEQWIGHHVQIKCDNMACVYVLNSGRSRDPFLLKCAREIWLLAATAGFTLSAAHITSHDNARADALSRVEASPQQMHRFTQLTSNHKYKCRQVDQRLFKLIYTL